MKLSERLLIHSNSLQASLAEAFFLTAPRNLVHFPLPREKDGVGIGVPDLEGAQPPTVGSGFFYWLCAWAPRIVPMQVSDLWWGLQAPSGGRTF